MTQGQHCKSNIQHKTLGLTTSSLPDICFTYLHTELCKYFMHTLPHAAELWFLFVETCGSRDARGFRVGLTVFSLLPEFHFHVPQVLCWCYIYVFYVRSLSNNTVHFSSQVALWMGPKFVRGRVSLCAFIARNSKYVAERLFLYP
jgi:hypothetical protein